MEAKSKRIAPMIGMNIVEGLFTAKCRPESIKSVILGLRNPLLEKHQLSEEFSEISELCERHDLKIGAIKWDDSGELVVEKTDSPVNWGVPKKILSKTLTSLETAAILFHQKDPRIAKENITLTQFFNSHPEAYFESDLD